MAQAATALYVTEDGEAGEEEEACGSAHQSRAAALWLWLWCGVRACKNVSQGEGHGDT